jgi:hypothetical protein
MAYVAPAGPGRKCPCEMLDLGVGALHWRIIELAVAFEGVNVMIK